MPDIEQRRKNFLFRTLAPYLELVPENDFHWICYRAMRAAFLVSAVPGLFTAVKLSFVEILTPDIVNSALREMSLVNAPLLLLLVAPYYVLKTAKVIGFSRIDYKRAFARSAKIKMPDWWYYDREKFIKKQIIAIPIVVLPTIFQWTGLKVLLIHFNIITNIEGIYLIIFLSLVLFNPSSVALILSASVNYWQYKYHYNEVPLSPSNTQRQGE